MKTFNLPKLWIFFEKNIHLLILATYFVFNPYKYFENYQLIVLMILLSSLYSQILLFGVVQKLEAAKRGLGERWLSISIGGNLLQKLNYQHMSTLTSLMVFGIACYFAFFQNEAILLKTIIVLALKDIMVTVVFHTTIKNFILKESLNAA